MDELQKKLNANAKKNMDHDKVVNYISNSFTKVTKFKFADIVNKFTNTSA